MATSSNSTQKTDQQIVDEKLKSKKIAAMVQTQNETTPVPAEKEQAFRVWIKENAIKDLDKPQSFYDYRGAFIAGAKPELSPDGKPHWPDTFKQHGHPTFTIESQYSKGPQDGGQWDGDTYVPQGEKPPVVTAASNTPLLDSYAPGNGPRPATPLLAQFDKKNDPKTPFLNTFAPTPNADNEALFDSITQRPSFPVTGIPGGRGGEFTDVVLAAASQLKDAAVGAINFTLGGASAAIPVVSEEEARFARSQGRIVQTENEIKQHRTAAAFVASSLAGGAATTTILKGLTPLAQNTLSGSVMGAAFGLVRPHEEGESLLGAVAIDALMFGGLSLGAGLIGKYAKPIKVGADQLEAAGIPMHPEVLKGPEYGKAIFEEANNIAKQLTGGDLADVGVTKLASLDLTIADNVANIGLFRRFIGSPSKWEEAGGPVGDAAGRIADNAGQRAGLARRLMGEWATTLKEAEDLLSTIKGGVKMPMLKEQLGKLLDNVFSPSDLPVTLHPNMAKAFEITRNRLLADREALRLLVGGSADWGIDAYLAHVHVGNWVIKDATTDQILRIVNLKDLKSAAADIASKNPGISLAANPKNWEIPAEMAGLGLTGRQLGRFISRASDVLNVSSDDLAQIVFSGKIARVSPGKKFSPFTLKRGDVPLEGWEADPFKALGIYATGVSRKIAFHDFEQKAGAILESLAKVPNTKSSIDALKIYIDRVLGRPSEMETAMRETLQSIARNAASPLGPGAQNFADIASDPRVLLGKVNQISAMAKLGYSPVSWFVNMSQTLTNTSSALGWTNTMRGFRLLLDRSQRPQVEALLRSLDIDLAVPLTAADQIVIRNVGEVSPLHPLYLFNKVETANRAIAGLAKYQERVAVGDDVAAALEASRKFIRETQLDYSMADTPRLLQGPLGSTIFQFKKFLIKELEFMWSLRNNPAAMARFTVNIQALGGVTALFGLPPALLVDYLSGEITDEKISERLQRSFPRASRGIPGALGVDVSGSVAIGLPKETGDIIGPGISDLFALAKDGIAKPTIDAIRHKGGHLTPADRGRLVGQIVPVVARRLMDAYDIYQNGVVRSRGTTQLRFTPEDPNREAALSLFGFRSIERSEEQRANTTMQRQDKLHSKDEQAVLQKWGNAFLDGDEALAEKILKEAEENGLVITQSQIKQAAADALIERTTRNVKRAPPELRANQLERLPEFLQP